MPAAVTGSSQKLATPFQGREPVIVVENLTCAFGERVILENVSFEVHRGEIFVILGGSGCGKSTLLKHLIGLYPPAAGRIVVNGIDITSGDERALARMRREIGVLFQSSALFGSMTLGQNIALPLEEYTDLPPEAIDLVVRLKLRLVNLAGFEDYLPEELSGGMKKRAGLARALALDPDLLFFDEPSAGLDPITAVGLDQLILRLNAGLGATMVVVTHELQSILTIAHRVIMLDKDAKGIIAMGDPHDLKEHSTDPRVVNFFHRRPPEG